MVKVCQVKISKDGRVIFNFEGLAGDTCYVEANKINQKLKELGIDLDLQQITPKEQLQANTEARNLMKEVLGNK